MNCPDYNSSQSLKDVLDKNSMAMQKKFGQNFMVNPNARSQIISMLDLKENETVWEIGPGLGAMTSEILSKKVKMKVFEIDRGFISLLHLFFDDEEKMNRFSIVAGDVLKNWKKEADNCDEKTCNIKLFGNLPYNIAASFIADTITEGYIFKCGVFTVQKEVADRMKAKPSSKDYSSFSVLCQWLYDVKPGIVLSSANFWPRPNVASQAVLFTPKKETIHCEDRKLFVQVVHTLFSQRRKTLLNNIKSILPEDVDKDSFFANLGISPSERAENLSVDEFTKITNLIFAYRNNKNGTNS